ncbi:MAG: alpha/beta fold hydrolase [Pseudomonadota bacterium]|nr:alpha/beta fold hydrolase [Pseudomonadota bacterium]
MALLFALLSAVALAAGVAFPTSVVLTTADGQTLHANLGVPAKGVNGVVFVHMAGRNKEDWHGVADKLYRQGLLVLTVDLRGHGANVTGTAPTLTGADWSAMTEDVATAVTELRKRGAQKVALVGAEVGANLALLSAANDITITSVALLSPGLDYKGLATGEAAKAYGARPVFYAASRDDTYGLRSATALETVATGPHMLQVFEKAGKGTTMFNREPTLESLLLGFLNTSWTAVAAPIASAPTEIKVKAEDLTTTGTRLGERTPDAPK